METLEKIGWCFVLSRSFSNILIRNGLGFLSVLHHTQQNPIEQIYSLDHPNNNLSTFIEGGCQMEVKESIQPIQSFSKLSSCGRFGLYDSLIKMSPYNT